MPTENPKISAYVPQMIYDRFKQFQEERNLSMSQAAIELFAEYFGIDLNTGDDQQSTSSLLTRLNTVEAEISSLRELYNTLCQKVDLLQSTSELPYSTTDSLPFDSNSLSKLPAEPKTDHVQVPLELNSGLQSELPVKPPKDFAKNVGSEGDLLSELPQQLPLIESPQVFDSELLNRFKSSPLSTKLLTSRIGMKDPTSLSHKKRELSPEEFSDWLQDKDPDGIKWLPIFDEKSKVSRVKGYVPSTDTPLEKLQRLEEWIKLNF